MAFIPTIGVLRGPPPAILPRLYRGKVCCGGKSLLRLYGARVLPTIPAFLLQIAHVRFRSGV